MLACDLIWIAQKILPRSQALDHIILFQQGFETYLPVIIIFSTLSRIPNFWAVQSKSNVGLQNWLSQHESFHSKNNRDLSKNAILTEMSSPSIRILYIKRSFFTSIVALALEVLIMHSMVDETSTISQCNMTVPAATRKMPWGLGLTGNDQWKCQPYTVGIINTFISSVTTLLEAHSACIYLPSEHCDLWGVGVNTTSHYSHYRPS